MAVKTESFEQMPGGRYEIVARLGTGAFGSVYQAQDTFLNRPVAVKSIRLDTTLDPEHRKALNKRFIREAQVAAQLHHPNIVTIHDILFTPDTGFIVMEFIEGRTLQSLLKSERLPLASAIEIAAQVASALQYAHEHKIIHRDVKPANIMITPSFEARITDFGIAKSDGATHLTMSGSLVGTPDYMSPEQAKGEDVDCRSDIFSLGCVLFECTAGEKAFRGGSLTGVLLSIVNSDPFESKVWKSQSLPSALEAVMKRALAKEPEKRYSTAAELMAALRALDVEPEPAKPAMEVERSDEMLQSFKAEERPLKFASTLSDELQEMSLTPAQGFILSRIDGASRARDILALSPLPEAEVAATLADLIDKGLLAWGVPGASPDLKSSDTATRRRGAKTKPKGLDEAVENEMERLLDLAGQKQLSGATRRFRPSFPRGGEAVPPRAHRALPPRLPEGEPRRCVENEAIEGLRRRHRGTDRALQREERGAALRLPAAARSKVEAGVRSIELRRGAFPARTEGLRHHGLLGVDPARTAGDRARCGKSRVPPPSRHRTHEEPELAQGSRGMPAKGVGARPHERRVLRASGDGLQGRGPSRRLGLDARESEVARPDLLLIPPRPSGFGETRRSFAKAGRACPRSSGTRGRAPSTRRSPPRPGPHHRAQPLDGVEQRRQRLGAVVVERLDLEVEVRVLARDLLRDRELRVEGGAESVASRGAASPLSASAVKNAMLSACERPST